MPVWLAKFLQWLFVDVWESFGFNKPIIKIAKYQKMSRAGTINAIADLIVATIIGLYSIIMAFMNRPEDILKGIDRLIAFTFLCFLICVIERFFRQPDRDNNN